MCFEFALQYQTNVYVLHIYRWTGEVSEQHSGEFVKSRNEGWSKFPLTRDFHSEHKKMTSSVSICNTYVNELQLLGWHTKCIFTSYEFQALLLITVQNFWGKVHKQQLIMFSLLLTWQSWATRDQRCYTPFQ